MKAYYSSIEDMEGAADTVKASVVSALVAEGLLDREIADEWTKSHTIIYRDKNIFRTISNLWKNEQVEDNTWIISVVKKV